jgi:hypothetical protein
MGAKVIIKNHKKYGLQFNHGWLKGWAIDKKQQGIGYHKKYPYAGAKVRKLIIQLPSKNNPERRSNKEIEISPKNVFEYNSLQGMAIRGGRKSLRISRTFNGRKLRIKDVYRTKKEVTSAEERYKRNTFYTKVVPLPKGYALYVMPKKSHRNYKSIIDQYKVK